MNSVVIKSIVGVGICTLCSIAVFAAASLSSTKQKASSMNASVTVADYGTVNGQPAHVWTLTNSSGMRMKATDYGTIVTELWVPNSNGKLVDVVLGRSSVQEYIDRTQYFGCTAGRCANRIAKGQFTIDGKSSQVTCNNGVNSLHGGAKGFDKVLWKGESGMKDGNPFVTFTYASKDGEEGYPGNCTAVVTYTLTNKNELRVAMSATTDAPTPVNLAHHSYWNLGGHDSGVILQDELMIPADNFTPVDATLITTGEIKSVVGTPFDFRTMKTIGKDMGQLPATATDPGGFDHNWVINGAKSGEMRECAVLRSPKSGIVMTITSNQPGIQFYTGNFLDGVPGKNGAIYAKNNALCLESQAFPDSINKQGKAGWPDVILRPGQKYQHEMVHRFTVVE